MMTTSKQFRVGRHAPVSSDELQVEDVKLPARHVRSLSWDGDCPVDWVGGCACYHLDGRVESVRVSYAYRFDAVTASPDREWVVLYERLGTKALLLHRGEIVRELNRSFYYANIYEYPVCVFCHEGRTLLAHCPDEYNLLQIEDALTGERLTGRDVDDEAADFFHSRLAASPSGKRLLSAGWIWHPLDAVCTFDIARALAEPKSLDVLDGYIPRSKHVCFNEEASAAWQSDDRIITTGSGKAPDEETAQEREGRPPRKRNGVVVYDIARGELVSSAVLAEPAGTVMPVGSTHIVAFYGHPRLVRLSDGAVVHEWPNIDSGQQQSCIVNHLPPLPRLALDPQNHRFAIALDDHIHVAQIRGRRRREPE